MNSYESATNSAKFHILYVENGHHQAIQTVDEFVSASENVWRNWSLTHQWIHCSEWVPSEWVQTADTNIIIIHA